MSKVTTPRPLRLPVLLLAVASVAFLVGRWSSPPLAVPALPQPEPTTPSSPGGATPPAPPAASLASPDLSPAAPHADPEVDALKARLVGAYVVGGAADPIEFPAGLAPAYTPAGVQAWVDGLRARCPAAAAATIEVDCGEYPCVVAAGWLGDAKASDVACERPELAAGRQGEFSGKLGKDWLHGLMLPIGPKRWTGPGDEAQFDRRWEIRSRELRALLVERMTEEQRTRTP